MKANVFAIIHGKIRQTLQQLILLFAMSYIRVEIQCCLNISNFMRLTLETNIVIIRQAQHASVLEALQK